MQASVGEFLKPRVVKVTPTTAKQAKVVIEPFERGFGHTLGNALRRVLLSSMPGCAITEAEIDGVLHEYTSIEGVQEDVVDILLNLKQVAIRLNAREETELRLHKKGPGPVTAGDIQLDHDVEVLNTDLVIANLTKAGELNMTLKVERGRGYRPAIQRATFEESSGPIGRLQLDASFSPIRRVTYTVERARRAAHEPGQADPGHRDQRHDRRGRSDPPRRLDPEGSAVGVRAICRARTRAPPRPPSSSSIRSCCVRWTSSSSRFAARTA